MQTWCLPLHLRRRKGGRESRELSPDLMHLIRSKLSVEDERFQLKRALDGIGRR